MTKGGCPICGKPVAASYRPFCSVPCADLDLQRWLDGDYVISDNGVIEDVSKPADR